MLLIPEVSLGDVGVMGQITGGAYTEGFGSGGDK